MLGGFTLSGPGEPAYVDASRSQDYALRVKSGQASDCVARLAAACARHEACDPGRIFVRFGCAGAEVVLPLHPDKLGGASCDDEPRVRHAEGFQRPFETRDDARALD
jgi:hypothetical protein